jgi:16S rRNA (guanine527-N7)-methyltransferase
VTGTPSSGTPVSRETGPVPDIVDQLAGDRVGILSDFAQLLATDGVTRGLLGPREVPRLWERHLINCAIVAEAAPEGATVADVGSGAGLPGLVWAICRPDLELTLIEPLLRRVTFLEAAAAQLQVTNVDVVRGRAEELHGRRRFAVVTSRAVAPLDRLSAWCLPLVQVGGRMVAMKGASAAEEVAAARVTISRLGGGVPELVEHSAGARATTWAVHVARVHEGMSTASARTRGGRSESSRRR